VSVYFFAVYSGRDNARGHACIARAKDKAEALRAARSNGIQITRAAYAVALTVQQYAALLRGAGLQVAGVPEQMELLSTTKL
jgi:hypothetical protein